MSWKGMDGNEYDMAGGQIVKVGGTAAYTPTPANTWQAVQYQGTGNAKNAADLGINPALETPIIGQGTSVSSQPTISPTGQTTVGTSATQIPSLASVNPYQNPQVQQYQQQAQQAQQTSEQNQIRLNQAIQAYQDSINKADQVESKYNLNDLQNQLNQYNTQAANLTNTLATTNAGIRGNANLTYGQIVGQQGQANEVIGNQISAVSNLANVAQQNYTNTLNRIQQEKASILDNAKTQLDLYSQQYNLSRQDYKDLQDQLNNEIDRMYKVAEYDADAKYKSVQMEIDLQTAQAKLAQSGKNVIGTQVDENGNATVIYQNPDGSFGTWNAGSVGKPVKQSNSNSVTPPAWTDVGTSEPTQVPGYGGNVTPVDITNWGNMPGLQF
jgi:Tfp pilus assembly protein PilE